MSSSSSFARRSGAPSPRSLASSLPLISAAMAIFVGCGGQPPALPAAPWSSPAHAAAAPLSSLPSTDPPPTDPDGWFAVGSADPPVHSTVSGRSAALALDAQGQPWIAVTGHDGALRVGHLVGGQLELVPGLSPSMPVALGLRGAEPILATADQPNLTRVAERRDNAYRLRTVRSLCRQGQSMFLPPGLAVDQAGDLWAGCIEITRGPPPPGPRYCMEFCEDPIIAARLRLGRLVGQGWEELPSQPMPLKTGYITLTLDAGGEIDVHLGSEAQPSFHVDRRRRVTIVPSSGTASRGTLGVPDALRGQHRLGVIGADTGFAVVIAEGSEPWHPLFGAWSTGISGGGKAALAPAIALDRSGYPVVAWTNGAGTMSLRRWDGRAFQALPEIAGAGPHGLAVDAKDTIYLGAWSHEASGYHWQMHRVHDGAAEAAPLLASDPSEWTEIMANRTRLEVSAAPHVSFPQKPNTFAAPARVGFALDQERWKAEAVPPSLLPGPTMPWGTDPRGAVFAENSALAIGPGGRPLVVWGEGARIHVSSWDGSGWRPVSDASLPEVTMLGAPAITASAERVCIAWSNQSVVPAIFVRCHKASALQ